mmetsp:Transcript_36417/g.35289  ORF Transcript_36417/g.35289 Transcript_36417/m.35289 type:complete len:96 (+) Transcript_36417:1471-1758(+)
MNLGTFKTITCEWMSSSPVEGQVCLAQTEEEMVKHKNLISAMAFKANMLCHKTGIILFQKVSQEYDPFDAWNSTQVFQVTDLALTYGELVSMIEF